MPLNELTHSYHVTMSFHYKRISLLTKKRQAAFKLDWDML